MAQMLCVRLSYSWITATSGPGTSGSVSGPRRASRVMRASLCLGLHRGTAPSLGNGQEPLLSVTTMVPISGFFYMCIYMCTYIYTYIFFSFFFFFIAAEDCDDPGIPPGAQRRANQFHIGEKVTYMCHVGLDLLGSSERVCLESSEWSGSPPRCQGAVPLVVFFIVYKFFIFILTYQPTTPPPSDSPLKVQCFLIITFIYNLSANCPEM